MISTDVNILDPYGERAIVANGGTVRHYPKKVVIEFPEGTTTAVGQYDITLPDGTRLAGPTYSPVVVIDPHTWYPDHHEEDLEDKEPEDLVVEMLEMTSDPDEDDTFYVHPEDR